MELYRNILLAVCIVVAYLVIGALLKNLLTPEKDDEYSLDPEETKVFILLWPIVIIAAFALTVKEKWDSFRRR